MFKSVDIFLQFKSNLTPLDDIAKQYPWNKEISDLVDEDIVEPCEDKSGGESQFLVVSFWFHWVMASR